MISVRLPGANAGAGGWGLGAGVLACAISWLLEKRSKPADAASNTFLCRWLGERIADVQDKRGRSVDRFRKHHGCIGAYGQAALSLAYRSPVAGLSLHCRQAGILARPAWRSHALWMFVVTEADAAAIRTAFHEGGELSAAVELRRRFPLIPDIVTARAHVRTIVGWEPPPDPPCTVTRLHPGRR
jgi:hypothetical protein